MRHHLLLQGGLGNQILQFSLVQSQDNFEALSTFLVDHRWLQILLGQRGVVNYLDFFEFKFNVKVFKGNIFDFGDFLLRRKFDLPLGRLVSDYGHNKENCEILRSNVRLRSDLHFPHFDLNFDKDLAVHIRGGDYLLSSNDYFAKLGTEYYNRAIANFSTSEKIVVFTDDIDHAKSVLGEVGEERLLFRNGRSDIEDFVTLSKFRNIVCANSTFSLTAALLGGANFVFPVNYFSNGRENPFLNILGGVYV